MKVVQMVIAQLKSQKLDGLYNVDNECDCAIEDSILCSELLNDCQGGINIPSTESKFDFYVSSPGKALDDWPKCSQCGGSGVSAKTHKNLTPPAPCVDCRSTGRFIRNDNDFTKLNDLLYNRTYDKLLAQAKKLKW